MYSSDSIHVVLLHHSVWKLTTKSHFFSLIFVQKINFFRHIWIFPPKILDWIHFSSIKNLLFCGITFYHWGKKITIEQKRKSFLQRRIFFSTEGNIFTTEGNSFTTTGKCFTIEGNCLPWRENPLPRWDFFQLRENFLPLREIHLPLRENVLPLRENIYHRGKYFWTKIIGLKQNETFCVNFRTLCAVIRFIPNRINSSVSWVTSHVSMLFRLFAEPQYSRNDRRRGRKSTL